MFFFSVSVCGANTSLRGPMNTTEKLSKFRQKKETFPDLTFYCSPNVSLTEPHQAGEDGASFLDDDSEVEVVYVKEATAEQAALARELLLPPTFFCYQNEQGYTSDDQTDGECPQAIKHVFDAIKNHQSDKVLFCQADEDYESAVRALNGKLYPDVPQRRAAGRGDGTWLFLNSKCCLMQI